MESADPSDREVGLSFALDLLAPGEIPGEMEDRFVSALRVLAVGPPARLAELAARVFMRHRSSVPGFSQSLLA